VDRARRSSARAEGTAFLLHAYLGTNNPQLFWIDVPFYSLLLGLTKISIILFYIRLCHLYKTFCRICWIFMFAIGLNTIVFIFLSIFQCSPIRWNWDRFKGEDVDAQCLNLNVLNWAINITNIIFDIVVLVLPIPLVAKSTLFYLFTFSQSHGPRKTK
jgi:hypothetical protein